MASAVKFVVETAVNIVESTPVIGHCLALGYAVCGNTDRAKETATKATRTTAVIGVGALGVATGGVGLAGAAALGAATGQVWDACAGKFGIGNLCKTVSKHGLFSKETIVSTASLGLTVAGDAAGGYAGGRLANAYMFKGAQNASTTRALDRANLDNKGVHIKDGPCGEKIYYNEQAGTYTKTNMSLKDCAKYKQANDMGIGPDCKILHQGKTGGAVVTQEGYNLRHVIDNRLVPKDKLISQATHNVNVLKSNNLAHCDVKLDNCILTKRGDLKFIDWNDTKPFGAIRDIGTPQLNAPTQLTKFNQCVQSAVNRCTDNKGLQVLCNQIDFGYRTTRIKESMAAVGFAAKSSYRDKRYN